MRYEKTFPAREGGAPGEHLRLWSSLEDYELESYLAALGHDFPGISVTLRRAPTGEIAARLRDPDPAEGTADLVFGTAATTLCEPEIQARLADRRWVAASGFRNAVVVNAPALAARRLPAPQSFAALADPAYHGLLAFPDPALSGAGTLALAGLVQKLGPPRAWPVIAGIVRNTAARPGSSWVAARAALDPRTPIAVSVEIACLRLAGEDPSLRVIVPRDASAVELEGFAALPGSAHPARCQEILAWAAGDTARGIARRWRKVTLGPRGGLGRALRAQGSFVLDHERAARERASIVSRFASLAEGAPVSPEEVRA